MITRILHVSDLHFGAGDDPVLGPALAGLIEHVSPGLVIASGDLTNRGRRSQHERAAAFLRELELPVLATIVDVLVFDKDPAREDVPAVLFPAKDAEG